MKSLLGQVCHLFFFMEMGDRAVMELCLAKRESSLALVSSFRPPCHIWHMACPHLSFFLLPSLSPFLILSLLYFSPFCSFIPVQW